jgi:hypothetical protein
MKYIELFENFDDNLRKLVAEINKGHYSIDEVASNTQSRSKVYVVETENDKLSFWNSSNNKSFDIKSALSDIAAEILEGELSGSISSDFNEIMWEVEEK